MIDIGRTIGAGFRVIAANPVAAGIWLAANTVLTFVAGASTLPMAGALTRIGRGAADTAPDPAQLFGALGPVYAVGFINLLLQIVLWAAVYRAVLRPRDSGVAYLRIGGDELRLFVLAIVLGLIWFALAMVLGMVFVGLGVAAVGGLGRGGGPNVAVILLMIVFGLAMLCGFVFLSVRLALAWPLTFLRRKIVLGEAWSLSRGHFWAMFAAALVILVIYYIASAITSGLMMSNMMGALQAGGDSLAAQRDMLAQFTTLTPMTALLMLLSGAVQTLFIILMAAGIADALRQLLPTDQEELAAIYA